MTARAAAKLARHERMLDVLGQFRVLLRTIKQHYSAVEARTGLGGAQVWALAQIAAHPGPSVGELARLLSIHLSTASNMVRRLEEHGAVTRTREGADQRVVRLRVTPAGRKMLGRAPRPAVGALQQGLFELPARRLESLQRELALLLRHMKGGDPRAKSRPLAELVSRAAAPRPRSTSRRIP